MGHVLGIFGLQNQANILVSEYRSAIKGKGGVAGNANLEFHGGRRGGSLPAKAVHEAGIIKCAIPLIIPGLALNDHLRADVAARRISRGCVGVRVEEHILGGLKGIG